MANTTYILEQIKINGALEDLLAKSNGENVTVTYNGTEYDAKNISQSVNDVPNGTIIIKQMEE